MNSTIRSITILLLFQSICKSISISTTNKNMVSSLRSVKQILPATPKHWVGDGFNVHPVFGNKAFTEELSPFLMFDYATPKEFKPNSGLPRGVGRHPHRGFETVTIAFQGEVEHADSMGNRDTIKAGDVQWMTAGRGIIHQEFHSSEFSKKGGVFEMCQESPRSSYHLWVNLPKKDKMTKPGYQPIVDSDIPSVDIFAKTDNGESCTADVVGKVRVIAGSFQGTKGPASTYSPVELWDVSINEPSTIELPFPDNYNCILFVRRGKIDVIGNDEKKKHVGAQAVAIMEKSGGSTVRIESGEADTSVLIMGGQPLNEPIAARGPFVMNTFDEIMQANRDYQTGNFGT